MATSSEGRLNRYIRYIEVNNFKSYKGKHVIGKFKNYTCVIGPNGSGKSNLMDAISFVMGIKASNLRTSKLKNLIYNGGLTGNDETEVEGEEEELTRERKSKKTLKAYVKVVFMDGDKEVEFMRTIDQNGSKFKIDGKTVKFDAYEAKLMSFGIIPSAKNFLVFQGDVSSIASKNPHELTTLIEHVSGSYAYKKEYETLKREHELAADKLMMEYQKKKNVNQERQKYTAAKKDASQFDKLVSEHTEKQVEYVLWRLYHIEAKIREYKGMVSKNKKETDDLNRQLGELGQAIAPLKAENAKLRANLAGKRATYSSEKKKVLILEGKLNDLTAKMQHLQNRIERNLAKEQQLNHESTQRKEKIDNVTKDIQKVKGELTSLDEEERAQTEQMSEESKLKQADLEEYQQLKRQAGQASFSQQSKIEALKGRLETMNAEKRTIQDRLDLAKGEEKEIQGKIKVKRGQIEDAQHRLVEIKQTLEPLDQKYKDLNRKKTEMMASKSDDESKLEKIRDAIQRARFEEDEANSQQAYNTALENIKRNFNGVYGKLTDLFTTHDQKYDVAVQVAIGNKNAYAVVVDTTETAFEAIQYLKDQRLPELVFIPLDGIRPKKINESLRAISESARLVYDVISVEDPTFDKAIRFVVGNTVLFSTLDEATDICLERNTEYKIRAVTLDGTLINKNGSLVAGLKEVEDSLTVSSSKKQKTQSIDNLLNSRDKLMESIRETTIQIIKDETVIKQLESDKARYENLMQKYTEDLGVLEEVLQNLETKGLEAVEIRIETDTKRLQDQKETIVIQENEVKQIQEEINNIEKGVYGNFIERIGYDIREYERAITEKQITLARKRSELETVFARLEGEKAFLEGEQELAATSVEDKEDLNQQLDQLDRERNQVETNHAAATSALVAAKSAIDTEKAKLKASNIQLNDTNRQSTVCQDEIKKKLGRHTHATNLIKQWQSKRESIVRQCDLDDIGLPFEEVDKRPTKRGKSRRSTPDIDPDAMQDEDGHRITFSEYIPPPGKELDSSDTFSPTRKRGRPNAVRIDFRSLPDNVLQVSSHYAYKLIEDAYHKEILNLEQDMEKLAPAVRGSKRLQYAEDKYEQTTRSFDEAREASKETLAKFEEVKERRALKFKKAFNHISENIDKIYKNLTKSTAYVYGGTAVLSLEDSTEPYLAGIKYNVMPPLKRFHYMDQLSGGERTVAALALLFAIHNFRPSPFFVLDEIDAALDFTNVSKVSNYIQVMATQGTCQFIVISLKDQFFSMSDRLIGICKDHASRSSMSLHFDLSQFALPLPATGPSMDDDFDDDDDI